MSFVLNATRDSTRVEDLFTYDGRENAFIVATLSDGYKLFLSRGASLRRDPWPLWLEPYTIEHPSVCSWLDTRRDRMLALRPQLTEAYVQSTPRGVGSYIAIRNLALGESPVLEHEVVEGSSWHMRTLDEASFTLEATVIDFAAVTSREGIN